MRVIAMTRMGFRVEKSPIVAVQMNGASQLCLIAAMKLIAKSKKIPGDSPGIFTKYVV